MCNAYTLIFIRNDPWLVLVVWLTMRIRYCVQEEVDKKQTIIIDGLFFLFVVLHPAEREDNLHRPEANNLQIKFKSSESWVIILVQNYQN